MGKVNRPPPKYKANRRPVPDVRADLAAIMERMENRMEVRENGCVEWVGFKSRLGYGHVSWKGRDWMAHRLVYAAHHGPHDPWLDIRHACDNPSCVEIKHLGIGTRSDNMRDSVDRRRSKNAKKTHCPQGHDYAIHGVQYKARTSAYKPWRQCRECTRIRHRLRWHNNPALREKQKANRARRLGLPLQGITETRWYSRQIQPERFGQPCRVVGRPALRQVVVEFDDGQRAEASFYAIRRPKARKQSSQFSTSGDV